MKKIIILILVFVYVFSPLDLIPDAVPFLGWCDDVAVLWVTLKKRKKEVIHGSD